MRQLVLHAAQCAGGFRGDVATIGRVPIDRLADEVVGGEVAQIDHHARNRFADLDKSIGGIGQRRVAEQQGEQQGTGQQAHRRLRSAKGKRLYRGKVRRCHPAMG